MWLMDVIEIEILQKPFKVKRGLGCIDVFFLGPHLLFWGVGWVESFSAT